MILSIDASNIHAGGGKTHLIELLRNVEPQNYGFEKVFVYANPLVLGLLPDCGWLIKCSSRLFSYGYAGRILWQMLFRSKTHNGIWFVPGAGTAPGKFVTMCQNLLPLEKVERNRYFFSFTWVRLVLLGWLHLHAFKKASGVIFLNEYCFRALSKFDQRKVVNKVFIPHGVSGNFARRSVDCNSENGLKLIYVSTIEEYKHHWNIAEAIEELRRLGYNISIDFIGAANPVSIQKLAPYLSDAIRYQGPVLYTELPRWYAQANAFIFGSTCETFGMVLLEAMASGLPVLSSHYSSMPETLEDNALYFDPLDPKDIARVIKLVYANRSLLSDFSKKALIHAQKFNWEQTSSRTFEFLAACAKKG